MLLFLAEMWKRFSCYGMRAIFMLYLVDYRSLGLAMADTAAFYGI